MHTVHACIHNCSPASGDVHWLNLKFKCSPAQGSIYSLKMESRVLLQKKEQEINQLREAALIELEQRVSILDPTFNACIEIAC